MTPLLEAEKISTGYMKVNMMLTDSGVAVVGLSGLVTMAAAGHVMRDVMASQPASSFCIYADRAVLAVGADDLASIQGADVSAMSGALVVDVGMLEMMRDYARRMARLGIVRRVFTSRVKALAWATDQSRLAVAQARWEMAHCPSL